MRFIFRIVSDMDSRIDQFLHVVEAYCAATKRSEARVSTLVLNGGRRIADIRAGKDVGTRILDGAFQWLSDHWPDGLDWPEDVVRPAASASLVAGSPSTGGSQVEAV